jgi:hypothetical protein
MIRNSSEWIFIDKTHQKRWRRPIVMIRFIFCNWCHKRNKMVRTPCSIIWCSYIHFPHGVRPQNSDLVVTNGRWCRCKNMIQNRHIFTKINFWVDTAYITSQYITQSNDFVQFRVSVIFAYRFDSNIDRPDESRIHASVEVSIFYQFNNCSN